MTTITSTTYPALWSFVQLVRATMDVDTSCEVKTLLTRDDLDRYEAAMIEIPTYDFLVLAGVVDDQTRFDELRWTTAHQVAAMLA